MAILHLINAINAINFAINGKSTNSMDPFNSKLLNDPRATVKLAKDAPACHYLAGKHKVPAVGNRILGVQPDQV